MVQRRYYFDTVHQELLRDLIQERLTREEGLHWMLLLLTHEVHLREPLVDMPDRMVAPSITWRVAANVIANLWPDRLDRRDEYIHWYSEYTLASFPGSAREFSPELREKVAPLRDRLLAHPAVAAVVEDREL